MCGSCWCGNLMAFKQSRLPLQNLEKRVDTLTFIMSIMWIGVLTFIVLAGEDRLRPGCAVLIARAHCDRSRDERPGRLHRSMWPRAGRGTWPFNAIGSSTSSSGLGSFILSSLIYDAPVRVGSEEDFGELVILSLLFAVLAVVLILRVCALSCSRRWRARFICVHLHVYETAK